jgi:hypothetical protein
LGKHQNQLLKKRLPVILSEMQVRTFTSTHGVHPSNTSNPKIKYVLTPSAMHAPPVIDHAKVVIPQDANIVFLPGCHHPSCHNVDQLTEEYK